jgi:hypothetical protein
MAIAKNFTSLLFVLILSLAVVASTQQDQHHNDQQDKHRVDGVNKRGDNAMGFSHKTTTHHFRLTADGGIIEVTANDRNDAASREQIRTHLSRIAKLFKEGDFSAPMFIHDAVPPGVSAMKSLQEEISYKFESIDLGGRVRITTANAEAIGAIHEFLKYQIKDHQTGDPLKP